MLLALDLGTETGWALNTDPVSYGTWHNKQSRFEGGGMRFLRFRKTLTELHDLQQFEDVYFEEIRRHLGTDAAHVYGGMLAHLTAWCEERGIPYEGVPVGTIKRFATGTGNAPKDLMLAVARSWGYEPKNDNEADALCLLKWAKEQTQ